MSGKRKAQYIFVAAAMLAGGFTLNLTAPTAASLDPPACPTARHLEGSHFEIDLSANLTIEGGADCIDWLTNGLTQEVLKNDEPSGGDDNSFGKGTAENDPIPKLVTGSIPPNKSDLTHFGVSTAEKNTGDGFLELFWARVQNPSGTTNMDFELNRLFCDGTDANCEDNTGKGDFVTPERMPDDKLISYDLSKGGTTPTISIRTWNGSAWVNKQVISGPNAPDECSLEPPEEIVNCAIGSVNTQTIEADHSGGIGELDPYTFGEAAISYEALFGGDCGSFGSAYLKSRSSDSFSSEIKDFIAPKRVDINNCPVTIQTVQSFIPQDTVTINGIPGKGTPTGQVTFSLYNNDQCTETPLYTETKSLTNGSASTSNSGDPGNNDGFTVTSEGTYKWVVSYDANDPYLDATSPCGHERFTVDNDFSPPPPPPT